MPRVQTIAQSFGWLNLLIGIAGFAGPLVTGNRDRIVNVKPGWLLGVVAINWLHALLHLVTGLVSLPMYRTVGSAVAYLRLIAAVFGPLMAIGFWTVRGQSGIHLVMGMAVDARGNLLHLAWTGIGLLGSLAPPLRQGNDEEPAA